MVDLVSAISNCKRYDQYLRKLDLIYCEVPRLQEMLTIVILSVAKNLHEDNVFLRDSSLRSE